MVTSEILLGLETGLLPPPATISLPSSLRSTLAFPTFYSSVSPPPLALSTQTFQGYVLSQCHGSNHLL